MRHAPWLPPSLIAWLATAAPAQWSEYSTVGTNPWFPAGAVRDAARGIVLVPDGDSNPTATMWEWDGARFRQRHVVGGGVGHLVGCAFDTRRRVLVGVAAFQNGSILHEFDGASWRQVPIPTAPGTPMAGAYDERRGRYVLYRGSPLQEWDGSTWTGAIATSLPQREYVAMAYDRAGQRIVFYGGGLTQGTAGCYAYDGTTVTRLQANAPPGPRTRASLTFDPVANGLVLYGGSATDTTTWLLQGSTWTQLATAQDPGPRSGAHMVDDGQGLLLFGGNYDRDVEVWRLTGSAWTLVAVTAPSLRLGAIAAFDRTRGETVLFGGSSTSGTPRNDTWRWSRSGGWRRAVAPVAPPSRGGTSLVWSSFDNGLLLFGGVDPAGNVLADTWLWNGATWLQRAPATSPPGRARAAIAEDPRGGVLLFGGSSTGGASSASLGDHWWWNGLDWIRQTPAVLPRAQTAATAARDEARNVVVLHGGYASANVVRETWEWNGSGWTQFAVGSPIGPGGMLAYRPDTRRVYHENGASPQGAEWMGATWALTSWTGIGTGVLIGSTILTDPAQGRVLRFPQPYSMSGVGVLTDTARSLANFGAGCARGDAPVLSAVGDATPGNAAFVLDAFVRAPNAPCLFAFAERYASVPLGSGCALLVDTPFAVQFRVANGTGVASLPLPLPPRPDLRGIPLFAQTAALDPPRGALGAVTLTDALRVRIGD